MLYRRTCIRLRSRVTRLLSYSQALQGTPSSATQLPVLVPHRALECSSIVTTSTYLQRRYTHGSSSGKAAPNVNLDEKIGEERYPIVQYPARTLSEQPYALDLNALRAGEYDEMIAQLRATRHYYQYPSLSAPQIGWNVQVFTLSDDSVYVNPVNIDAEAWAVEAKEQSIPYMPYEEKKIAELRRSGQTGFAWEPCASCCHMLYYIERPLKIHLRAYNERGVAVDVTLSGMTARMALHEMDHMQGILFARRVVDTDHVVPMSGFTTMSDWSDDFPSLEARSTFLYTIFTPPYHFHSEAVPDAAVLDRHFEDGIYPGVAFLLKQQLVNASIAAVQRKHWQDEKQTRLLPSSSVSEADKEETAVEGGGGDFDEDDEAAMTTEMEKKVAAKQQQQRREDEAVVT